MPSRNWWYCWNDFDPDSVARDFDAIAGLHLDHIRIFPIWPYFQPNPKWVSDAHLGRLASLMELASQRGIDVCVTPLTGFLSGYHFRPPFYSNESVYSHPALIEAEHFFLAKLAYVLNKFDNFLGFDLGNEINCYRSAPIVEGNAWMSRMLDYCAELSPDRVHVNGVDHQPWFAANTFSADALATAQEIVALHCWIYFTGALERGGPLDPPSVHLAAAMAALARSYANEPSKPIWVQEYGSSLEWMSGEQQVKFVERSTLAAIDAGVSWSTWWCSHDISPEFEFAGLEYDLGLLTVDNKPKAHAAPLAEIAKSYSGKAVAIPQFFKLPPPPVNSSIDSTWEWLQAWIAERA